MMTSTEASRDANGHRNPLGFLPVLGFLAATVGLAVFPVEFGGESAVLLMILNTVFLCAAPLGVALMAARAYRATGSLTYLLQGCGLVALATSSLFAGPMLSWSGDANAAVTLHNLGALFAGVCQLAGARVLITELAEGPKFRRIAGGVWPIYLGIGGAMAAVAVLALRGALPVFIQSGVGPSPLRQCVVGGALCLFALSGFAFVEMSRFVRSRSTHCFGVGLWLIAVGLAAVLLQPAEGSALGWVGRAAQYLGCVYLVVSVLRARRDTNAPSWRDLRSLWPELEQRIADRAERIARDDAARRDAVAQRLRTEADLKSKDLDLEQAQALAHLGSWQLEIDEAGEHWSGSAELRRIYGYAPDCPIDMQTGKDRIHPADRALVTANWSALLGGESAGEWTHRLLIDGRTQWIKVNAKPHRDSAGRLRRVTGIVQDITASKVADEESRERERQLAQALDQAHLSHWEMDSRVRLFIFNDRFYALYGTTAEREGGYRMSPETYAREFLPPEERPLVASVAARLLSGEVTESVIEHRILRRDGEIRHVLVRIDVVRDAAGKVIGTRGTNQDITDLRRVETSLRENEELFRSVVTAMAEGVVVHRADGTIIDCNRQAEVILGLRRDQIMGRTPLDPRWQAIREDGTPFPGDEHPAMISLRTGRGLSAVVMGLHLPSGELRWFNINSEPLPGTNRLGPRAVVCTFADVTHRVQEQKRVRELLTQSDRDARTKSNLLREVNHRVTNNLTSILGLLAYEVELTKADDRPAIDPVLQRLAQRIGGLLTAHRLLSDSEWSPVRIDHLAEKVIGAAISADPMRRPATVSIAPSPIEVSPRQASNLALVLNELTTNSVKHGHRSGVSLRVELRISLDDGLIAIAFRDNGPGFPPDVLSGQESNVGLKLVRLLVTETLRGRIALGNDGGGATTLHIRPEEPHRT